MFGLDVSRHHLKPDEFLKDAHARQRNIVFPDTVRNGRAVDVFLWRGSPNPTVIQRIGAWIFGLQFIASGLLFMLVLVPKRRNFDSPPGLAIFVIIGLFCFYVGGRIIRNGFPRKPSPGDHR